MDTTNPDTTNPETTNPESTNPDTTDPDTTPPAIPSPEATDPTRHPDRRAGALRAGDPSARLRAVLAAGSAPEPALLEALAGRLGAEPDPFVREALSWALTRLPPAQVLPRLRRELDSGSARARAQALHTLSKIGDPGTRAWITDDLLRDPDDEVARTAWRVAVALVPEDRAADLAGTLAGQLGRGDRAVRLSLSRALVALGEVVRPVLARAAAHPDPVVAAHARATELLLQDPERGFDAAIDEARRVAALGPTAARGAAEC